MPREKFSGRRHRSRRIGRCVQTVAQFQQKLMLTIALAQSILGVQTLGHVKHNGEQALIVALCIAQPGYVAAAPQN